LRTLTQAVKDLGEHQILPVCFDQRLGQIIAQTMIEERLETLYHSLFSFEGSEVYKIPDASFETVLHFHTHAIPVMAFGKDTFALSLSRETSRLTATKPPIAPVPLSFQMPSLPSDFDIVVIGRNNKLHYIEEAFSHYEKVCQTTFGRTAFDHDRIDEAIRFLNEAKRPTKVLLLSGDAANTADLDADIFESLIRLETDLANPLVSIVVEILNPKHGAMIRGFRIKHTIVSNKIISLLLSKLAFDVDTESFYHQLLTIDPTQQSDMQSVVIAPAGRVLKTEDPLSFASVKQFVISLHQSSGGRFVALGVFRQAKLTIFEGDLTNRPLQIEAADDLVLMRVKD
jgi:hypothetical protein